MNATRWRQHVNINRLQSLLLLMVMVGFLALLGALLWGREGIYILISLGLLMLVFNPSISPVLVMRLYQARPLHPRQAPSLYAAIEALSARAELPRIPQLYYLPSGMLNAFAVGSRKQAAIAVSDGLLRSLDHDELIAVLAHEISHVRSNDMRVMGLADMFSRLTSLLSLLGQLLLIINLPLVLLGMATINWFAIIILILAPTISALAQLGLSRTREYHADLNAAALTGDPQALARALVKIDRVQGGWLERLLLPGRSAPEPSMLRTHPPTEERVQRLMELKPHPGRQWLESRGPVQLHAIAPVHRSPGWHWHGLWY